MFEDFDIDSVCEDILRGCEEPEPCGPNDYSDDAYVLASAGMGTDEDYGCFDSGLDDF